MALLSEVKKELVHVEPETVIAQKAQIAAMMRIGGGLRPERGHLLIRAQFDSETVAMWLKDAIRMNFQRDAHVREQLRKTPQGSVLVYEVIVEQGAPALALQTGLLNRRMQVVKGLPPEITSGTIAQVKATWRGAFLAHGRISDPGKASYLEVVCPSEECAIELETAALRLGIRAKTRTVGTSERVTLNDPDSIERMLNLLGAPLSAREWTGKRYDGEARGKANRLANFDDANMRRSAKAAAEACEKVRKAFEILGENIPENLRAAGELRLRHGNASLEELGRLAEPQITKDAVAGRIRRLLQMAEKEMARNNNL